MWKTISITNKLFSCQTITESITVTNAFVKDKYLLSSGSKIKLGVAYKL